MLRILSRAKSRGIVRAVKCTSTAMTRPPPGKMFSLQASLPRLPVPPLDQTLNKYLRSVRPLLSDEEFKNTEQIVQEFRKNPGPKLQTLLEHRASQEENWVIQGMGIDRHLLGLKLAAIKNGMNVPDLHMDMAYTLSTHFRMSTSQVPARSDSVLVFGPVVPDGYGVCYNPQESQVHFGVSAFNITPETNSKNYINMLRKTLLEMRDLFQGSVQSKL